MWATCPTRKTIIRLRVWVDRATVRCRRRWCRRPDSRTIRSSTCRAFTRSSRPAERPVYQPPCTTTTTTTTTTAIATTTTIWPKQLDDLWTWCGSELPILDLVLNVVKIIFQNLLKIFHFLLMARFLFFFEILQTNYKQSFSVLKFCSKRSVKVSLKSLRLLKLCSQFRNKNQVHSLANPISAPLPKWQSLRLLESNCKLLSSLKRKVDLTKVSHSIWNSMSWKVQRSIKRCRVVVNLHTKHSKSMEIDPKFHVLTGKIYRSAHTLRTHLEDKHTVCPGYRCVLCGTVAKSRNSLHSHMSRQHRGISTKDLPVVPMPAPFDPVLASCLLAKAGVKGNHRQINSIVSFISNVPTQLSGVPKINLNSNLINGL